MTKSGFIVRDVVLKLKYRIMNIVIQYRCRVGFDSRWMDADDGGGGRLMQKPHLKSLSWCLMVNRVASP